jgi:calcineurin-like phosphoesterase family protein
MSEVRQDQGNRPARIASKMRTFFTADHHFFHARIIELCKRPFRSIEDMHVAMIAAWNKRVQPDDRVYHLGDIMWGRKGDAGLLDALNGSIVLVAGNHDTPGYLTHPKIIAAWHPHMVKVEGQSIWLAHYAHRVWPKSHHGSWHLYGHSHGNLADDPNSLSMDVGVDTRPEDFAPWSFAEIEAYMAGKTFKPVDHHGRDNDE